MVAGLEIGYLLHSPLPYDPVGYLVGRDFANTWVGAQLALTGHPQTYFAADAYNRLLAEKFGASYPLHIWSYPPHVLLFTWPLALIPYMAAYILYCALGLAVYLAVTSAGGRRLDHLVLLAIAPAVIVNIWCGQNGFFVAALLAGGLMVLDRRPILAGLLFGMLSIKPQLGILLPLMLALTGRWRTVLAAATTVLLLVTVASFVFGVDV
jgi:alpha-1,2-mannosyltransferase